MSEPTAPHDSLFKHVFSRVESGAALLRGLLPRAIVDRVDWSTLELRSGSFKDAELQGLESDLLFSARLGDRDALFYVLIEHQSSTDARMAWRMWRYVTRVWERYGDETESTVTLPVVIPVVIYHGARRWTAARSITGLLDADEDVVTLLGDLRPELTYVLDDLSELDGSALRARALPAFATLALWALRTASDRGFAPVSEELVDLFDAVRESEDGRAALWTLFSYLSTISAEDEDLVGQVLEHLSPPVRENVMDLVEHFAEEKKAEGRTEGRAEVLLKLLTLKFGVPPTEIEARVAAASLAETDRWAERILTAATLEEVFAAGEGA